MRYDTNVIKIIYQTLSSRCLSAPSLPPGHLTPELQTVPESGEMVPPAVPTLSPRPGIAVGVLMKFPFCICFIILILHGLFENFVRIFSLRADPLKDHFNHYPRGRSIGALQDVGLWSPDCHGVNFLNIFIRESVQGICFRIPAECRLMAWSDWPPMVGDETRKGIFSPSTFLFQLYFWQGKWDRAAYTLSTFLLNLFRLIQIVLGSFSISVNLVAFLLLEQSRQWYLSLPVSFSALKKSLRHSSSSTWSCPVSALMIGTLKTKYFSDCSLCVTFNNLHHFQWKGLFDD